jgi:hypothetical protein
MFGGIKMLTKMLEESGALKDKTPPDKAILMKLASVFQDSTQYLFLDPQELHEATEVGSKELWKELLLLQETQNFVTGSMAFLSQIAQRKTFQSLVQGALTGNQQAAKQVQELSGILNQQDTNRVVVLHQIPRPTKQVIDMEELK